ncbi:protein NipSnap homolog 3A isoform X1 [Vulpes vulpes]|nr:protein NipSnap homolog 3A isoform X3 [Canis lupus familiaris]XP_038408923.1 protein NipSnap homolog 3A isoform X3 [Canis lupus familiaris]XP_038538258.1 protein NipSnap homolog 3A isoform X3 [Canis lupus familiaris]XP_041618895.1 protein NipSnap homolog 3A isoform X2 [Vulpes lagopus]XP_055158244.1 protein NipSnap homolog 3A isoform X3 [Nyctereutes procyonoides]|eukprot:XP_022281374.1 protein NipSnap homolog 3A isoform X2 [Canis lupus familiaris]
MLVLRSRLAAALAARTLAPQVCSSFATGPRQYDGTFYEFRTYYLKPSKMNEFLENTKKNIHLRTAHSELVGYWSVEFGGRMNKVFHIWKYDNFAHRTEVRKALAKDKEWQEQYLIPNLALIDKQESEITYLVPWSKLEEPPKEVHVLWWNESADSRAAGRHQSHEDPRVVAAVRESVHFLESQQNMLLIPTSFSPLK